ncbi:hypothetical protein LIER_25090 [Lithospermum erythrorhizon]|uniref:Transposase (putative) gypsy type domain-containing protein n=1 Tax=Lithospermum erythrorhizon TaxID=34254 RepID=A0AAV3R6N7_LITER
MSLLPVVDQAIQEPTPSVTQVPTQQVALGSVQSTTPVAAEKMKRHIKLNGFSTYFSIPFDEVDTRLLFPGDQVILPRIEAGYTDPDLTHGYTAVYVESFSYGMRLPFSCFLNNVLITLNRAPGQLNPIGGGLNMTIFEVACRIVGVKPTISLFSALYMKIFKPFSESVVKEIS